MKTHSYEIGGIHVKMTPIQSQRWNTGNTTTHDLNSVRVFIPIPQNDYREISLRRATSVKMEPEISAMMKNCTANRIE